MDLYKNNIILKIKKQVQDNKNWIKHILLYFFGKKLYNNKLNREISRKGDIKMTDIIKELEERGYIEQLTHEKEMRELFQKESVRFYIGIDPTADSMHIGHFVALMVASRLQKAGHKPIILMGGGTATIGDPSGKTDMRKMKFIENY